MSVDSESLVERAIREVREHIRANDLKVGDTLPGEGRFATELGVSRAVMREAFGALAALKLIDVANGRRARVGAIDGSVMATSMAHAVTTTQISLAEVWDVRRTLELRTVELAAGHRTHHGADRSGHERAGHGPRADAHRGPVLGLRRCRQSREQREAGAGAEAGLSHPVRPFEKQFGDALGLRS